MDDSIAAPPIFFALLILLPLVFFTLGRVVLIGKGKYSASNGYISVIYACLFCVISMALYMGVRSLFGIKMPYLFAALFVLMQCALLLFLPIFSILLLVRKMRVRADCKRINDTQQQ